LFFVSMLIYSAVRQGDEDESQGLQANARASALRSGDTNVKPRILAHRDSGAKPHAASDDLEPRPETIVPVSSRGPDKAALGPDSGSALAGTWTGEYVLDRSEGCPRYDPTHCTRRDQARVEIRPAGDRLHVNWIGWFGEIDVVQTGVGKFHGEARAPLPDGTISQSALDMQLNNGVLTLNGTMKYSNRPDTWKFSGTAERASAQ
jgi:hypothetical protein